METNSLDKLEALNTLKTFQIFFRYRHLYPIERTLIKAESAEKAKEFYNNWCENVGQMIYITDCKEV